MKRLPLLVLVLCACSSTKSGPQAPAVSMHFERASFFDAPFPSNDLVKSDGTISIDGFPNPNAAPLVIAAKSLLADAHGFAEEGGVFFSLTGAIDPAALPADMAASVAPASTVFLVGVTPGAPDFLHRYPVQVRFQVDGGPFGAPNLLTIVPLQGQPLRPKSTYAAVVVRAAGVSRSSEMAAIAAGNKPPAMPARAFDDYRAAFTALSGNGVVADDIAGMAVFTTDDPTAALSAVTRDMLSRPLPVPDAAFHQTDLLPEFCVYASTIPMPDYQAGPAPYDFGSTGGAWAFDASGKPMVQRNEEAGIVVTIPRSPMPANGWPIVHFIRTGGGGDRPLVDRGPQATNGGPAINPGTGPALWFAKAGLAGASIDGPHENLRNATHGDEDFLMFNVFNPPALRDNVRESAAEFVLFAHILTALQIDVSDCPGTSGPAHFDATHVALMGHSMGATIAPLVLANDPLHGAAVLSGAGASWIENIIWKQLPLKVRPAFELLLSYIPMHRTLTEDDPVLTLFQWAEEPADPLVYTRAIIAEPAAGESPRHVLMEQGIVDHYIMPPIANAMSLSLGLDLAGAPLDASSAELTTDGTPNLEAMLQFSHHAQVPLPASGNVVVQHPADGIEDGHEIVFQTDAPKREYRCFLQSWVSSGAPQVPAPGPVDGPCQ